jgi:hypothetical protein
MEQPDQNTIARALRLLAAQKAASKRYYETNREAINERSKTYWEAHRENINARRRERYEATKPKKPELQ